MSNRFSNFFFPESGKRRIKTALFLPRRQSPALEKLSGIIQPSLSVSFVLSPRLFSLSLSLLLGRRSRAAASAPY